MAQSKATKRCSHFEITVVHDGNSTCVPCELCPPGQGLSVNCGATTNVFPKCVSCQEGKTFNNGKSYFQCSTCVPCGENQLIIGKCTIYNNTQCGGCRNGYYSEDSIYDCLPCSKCCGPPDAAFIAEKCIAHSIESICQGTERFLRDTPDASKETVIYTQRQMAKKVSDMPFKYRRDIGMRLATKNWETGPKPFLEKISVPKDEIDYICSNSGLYLWEKVMEQFSRKTNGQVATLVKLLNELEREDIIQECIYKWLDGKIEKRFRNNNRPLTFSTIA
ncbi:predicted protein [Nematostella vectensis]|uniref:TNFR-Cys domain-containing protein n=1 Tax=Nematostella vectensis TaxID=45351 RepID=A7SEX2_NEMVE|nr:predicted protein [Nematostella vectensis]|eukprot:XP_001629793.1 predicted protein [Nematostella vectensis]